MLTISIKFIDRGLETILKAKVIGTVRQQVAQLPALRIPIHVGPLPKILT